MTLKMIFVLLLLVVSIAGVGIHSYKVETDNEYGKEYWRNIKWAFIYSFGVLIGIGFSLDYFEPAAPTMEELNANPAWHNWLAGGLFALIVVAFAYSVHKAFKK